MGGTRDYRLRTEECWCRCCCWHWPQQRFPHCGPARPRRHRADILRGAYGPYRANNDLLFYHLDIRVDPEKKFLRGKNTIRFKMLKDGTRIQLDLHRRPPCRQDHVGHGSAQVQARVRARSSWTFPRRCRPGRVYSIDFYYSGNPVETGRFGGITFRKDPAGHPWINTACEGIGASVWWPNKDQWRDEVESMQISVSIPNGLVDVSNGKFMGKTDLGDGYTRWDWLVHYPINNYDVSLNIGNYEHFADRLGDLPLDFYVLPEDLARRKSSSRRPKECWRAYQHYFGEYPFPEGRLQADRSALLRHGAPERGDLWQPFHQRLPGARLDGRRHQPAFRFHHHPRERPRMVRQQHHRGRRSDMWIHEGWATYLESLYVEYMCGQDDALKYMNRLKSKVRNRQPIISQRGVNREPPQDQYFKGALFINTLRSVVDDDKRWWALLHGFYQHFKYQTIMTEDMVAYFNQQTGMNLTPIFDQYLRHTALPVLELKFESPGSVRYRWKADEPAFAMPVRVGSKDHWQIIHPTTEWQTMQTPLGKNSLRWRRICTTSP